MQKASVAYMQTQITTTNQGELLLMLYAGAINFLVRAREEIEKKNYAEKGMLISKAMDIIAELDGSLNMEKGGDLSKNLHQLYMFCNSHLLQASIKMNAKFVDDVVNILEGLRSAYAQVINTPEAISALSEAPAQDTADTAPRTTANRMFANSETPQAPTGPAMMGVSARAQSAAYLQQAQAARPEAAPKPEVAPQPEVSLQPQSQAVAAEALNALAEQAKQAVPVTPAPVAAPQKETSAAAATIPPPPAGFGFAKQMAGNAMYRKMSQA